MLCVLYFMTLEIIPPGMNHTLQSFANSNPEVKSCGMV
jgi:hypothetical protein